MKVEVIHKDEKRDGSIKYTLVASVNMCSPYYGLQDDLEFAYERTQNTEGSWSKDIGLPNPDGDRIHLTVEAPLPEFTDTDGTVKTLGHRSTMEGDVLRVVDNGQVRMFRITFYDFQEILSADVRHEITSLYTQTRNANRAIYVKRAIDNIYAIQAEELPSGHFRIVAVMKNGDREVLKKKSTRRPVAVQAYTDWVNGNARTMDSLSAYFKFAKNIDRWDRGSHYKTFSVS